VVNRKIEESKCEDGGHTRFLKNLGQNIHDSRWDQSMQSIPIIDDPLESDTKDEAINVSDLDILDLGKEDWEGESQEKEDSQLELI